MVRNERVTQTPYKALAEVTSPPPAHVGQQTSDSIQWEREIWASGLCVQAWFAQSGFWPFAGSPSACV